MSSLHAAVVGFDITPRFHPTCGAWGDTSTMTGVDMPLLARCVALQQDGQLLLWFGSDLVGESVSGTDGLRSEIAGALRLRPEQLIWSTSQTHSSGALPGSVITGSSICDLSLQDPDFMAAERKRFITAYVDAGREAISSLQPARVWAGRGYCDSMSYNTRFPMPTGGVKFSRHHAEGMQGGKPFDTTVGVLRFEDLHGRPLGGIFNFCAHPATMILGEMISPDYVGTARHYVEDVIDGAPVMFCQGFCGDVNCYHLFGSADQAKRTGARLGKVAAEAMKAAIPARGEPFGFASRTIELQCQPMPSREELQDELAERLGFIAELENDPSLTWVCGTNLPEQFSPAQRAAMMKVHIDWVETALARLDAGTTGPESLPITLYAIRIGDAAAVLSPGENLTETGMIIRSRSPFVHTLVCGDTNGLFGYIATDEEIDRGGYEADSYWKILLANGFRLPLAKGTAGRIVDTSLALLRELQDGAEGACGGTLPQA